MTDRCAECGFDYHLDEAGAAGPAIVEGGDRLAAMVVGWAGDVAWRPSPDVWSPLEYACHVRDVLLVQRERVLLARRSVRPILAPMGRDERVEHDGYSSQDPRDVARQLGDAARMFAHVLSRLAPADWDRTLMYNYPQPGEQPLCWVAVHTWHEVRHHLVDVGRQVPAEGS